MHTFNFFRTFCTNPRHCIQQIIITNLVLGVLVIGKATNRYTVRFPATPHQGLLRFPPHIDPLRCFLRSEYQIHDEVHTLTPHQPTSPTTFTQSPILLSRTSCNIYCQKPHKPVPSTKTLPTQKPSLTNSHPIYATSDDPPYATLLYTN